MSLQRILFMIKNMSHFQLASVGYYKVSLYLWNLLESQWGMYIQSVSSAVYTTVKFDLPEQFMSNIFILLMLEIAEVLPKSE